LKRHAQCAARQDKSLPVKPSETDSFHLFLLLKDLNVVKELQRKTQLKDVRAYRFLNKTRQVTFDICGYLRLYSRLC
jgi:hypothetical protein